MVLGKSNCPSHLKLANHVSSPLVGNSEELSYWCEEDVPQWPVATLTKAACLTKLLLDG